MFDALGEGNEQAMTSAIRLIGIAREKPGEVRLEVAPWGGSAGRSRIDETHFSAQFNRDRVYWRGPIIAV